jgi:hypothetical protein
MAKTWERLKREVESSGISALVYRQSFEEAQAWPDGMIEKMS